MTPSNDSHSQPDLAKQWTVKGRTVVITGGSKGIGKATAIALAKQRPRRIILACRDTALGEATVDEIHRAVPDLPDGTVVVRKIDLSSLDATRAFAENILATEPELHLLINNVGIIGPQERETTIDGFELTFATNHLGHFLLTNLLLDLLKKSAPSRIVIISGDAYKFTWPKGYCIDDPNAEQPGRYSSWNQYCQTKLANLLFAQELHSRLSSESNSGVSVFPLHPGVCTERERDHRQQQQQRRSNNVHKVCSMTQMFQRCLERCAANTIYCASEPGIEKYSGSYFKNQRPRLLWGIATDKEMAEKLWQLSNRLVGLDDQ